MEALEKMMLLSGCKDEPLARVLLDQAEQTLLNETRRTKMIPALFSSQIDLAIVMFNRLGTEGESSRSEGGISTSFVEMPVTVQRAIENNRLARCGGYAFEAKSVETLPGEATNFKKG